MNLQALAEALELDIETVRGLVETFLTTSERDLQTLALAVAGGDSGAVARVAHHIKGAAAALELEPIRGEAEVMERRAREGRLEGAAASLANLRVHLEAIRPDAQGPG